MTGGSAGRDQGERRSQHQTSGELLILDEPTAGLDADAELVVIAELRRLGVGALVVSHRPAVLAAADRVVELRPIGQGAADRQHLWTQDVDR